MTISHYSLYDCGITSTGAITLAEALQENHSLEDLMYVANTLIENLNEYTVGTVGQGCLA